MQKKRLKGLRLWFKRDVEVQHHLTYTQQRLDAKIVTHGLVLTKAVQGRCEEEFHKNLNDIQRKFDNIDAEMVFTGELNCCFTRELPPPGPTGALPPPGPPRALPQHRAVATGLQPTDSEEGKAATAGGLGYPMTNPHGGAAVVLRTPPPCPPPTTSVPPSLTATTQPQPIPQPEQIAPLAQPPEQLAFFFRPSWLPACAALVGRTPPPTDQPELSLPSRRRSSKEGGSLPPPSKRPRSHQSVLLEPHLSPSSCLLLPVNA
ncbi:hypothetical protein EMCRGX_G005160 [Ephydatia muelleri]